MWLDSTRLAEIRQPFLRLTHFEVQQSVLTRRRIHHSTGPAQKAAQASEFRLEAVEKLFSEWPLPATFPTLLRRGSNARKWHDAAYQYFCYSGLTFHISCEVDAARMSKVRLVASRSFLDWVGKWRGMRNAKLKDAASIGCQQ